MSRHRSRRVPRRRSAGIRSLAESRSTVVVAALSAGLGALMVTGSEAAHRIVQLGERTGQSATVAAILPVVSWVFIAIALYVSAVVTSNTCATVIAGQTRSLALQRVLGATGAQLRRRITSLGLVCGVVGAVVGVVVGTAATNLALRLAAATAVLPPLGWVVPPAVGPVALLVAVITAVAFRVGSRDVLTIPPLRALEVSIEPPADAISTTSRSAIAAAFFIVGAAGIGMAFVLGATTVDALLLAVVSGALSFTGVVIASPVLLPAVLRVVVTLTAERVIPSMAARNSLRSPKRTARATVGLVIAATLMTTFSVGFATYARMLQRQAANDPVYYRDIQREFDQLAIMFAGLVGAAGVIAAAGVIVVTALTIAQRRREIGLLRVIGATGGQIRTLVLVETAMTIAIAVVLGVVLGTVYGWAGAYTLLGATNGAQLIGPTVPAWLLVVVLVGAAGTGLAAAVGPAAQAARGTPVTALHE
jgi:putative ABC transport system permease protein